LSNSPATQLADNFNAVQNNSTTLLIVKPKKQQGTSKVNAKTGSAFSGSKPKNKTNTDKTVSKSSKKTVKSVSSETKIKGNFFSSKRAIEKSKLLFQNNRK
jgi:hypothetical protein